ncbi:MAG: 2-oxo acid dehydrogenase subunit E2 [Myxococcales bacterium FL481]|nr:MAG: 2-oxo acid dehydrogenase subunit E2 [Myxococcales bacterium FL481]
MIEFKMPSLGADMEAGTLVEWLVEPGQSVARGDIVAVVETQKGAIDIEVFASGKVVELLVEPGTEVPVGSVLAHLEGDETETPSDESRPDESASPAPWDEARPERPGPDAPASEPPTIRSRSDGSPPATPVPAVARGSDPTPARVSPRARRLADQFGVDLSQVSGSGPAGAITGEDVERASQPRPDGMRQAIAAAMTRANREIPHYQLAHRIDLHATERWLAAQNQTRTTAERLLPIVPVLRAIVRALSDAPTLNGTYADGRLSPATQVDLGVAVSLRGGGLVAPVIRNAGSLDMSGLMSGLRDLVARARSGELRSSEMGGGSITVTNLGERGVETVFGVIYPPQVALVGCGKPMKMPWVVDGRVEPRTVLSVSLCADHRVSDGHAGARFLANVDQLLQCPEAL